MLVDDFPHFSNSAALGTVPEELLLRLLDRWPDLFDGPRRRDEIPQVLAVGRAALPADLVAVLDRIEDLCTSAGFDSILSRLQAAGHRPALIAQGPSPLCLAVSAWLDHHVAFLEAEVRRLSQRPGRMREYCVACDGDLQLPSPEALAEVQEGLRLWSRDRGRGDFLRLGAFEEGDKIFIPIHRGRTLRTVPVVEGGEESSIAYRPRARDLAVYDHRTGRISLKASDQPSRVEYGRQLGQLLGTELYERPVVTLAPLWDDPRLALKPTPGIRSVAVVELQIRLVSPRPTVLVVKGPDVLSSVEDQLAALQDGEPISARLKLSFAKGRDRSVTLKPPNEVGHDRRTGAPLIRRFLEERGFLERPYSTSIPPAEPRSSRGQLGLFR